MKIFIGYDSRQSEAYDVCRWSMLKHNRDLEIVPLIRSQLPTVGHSDGSTEFTYTRFLVPHIENYQGWALFCDCDFLWLCDPLEILKYANEENAVCVVKHKDYKTKSSIKMDGVEQESYPKKNWSSLILWNCGHKDNRLMTPMIIRNSSPSWLHQFGWISPSSIGDLPIEYNWLAGYYNDGSPKAIHYTDGGPWFEQYKDCEYADLWISCRAEMR
jgi:hypothetical protein